MNISGQILRIRSKETRQEFIFVNTHLLLDPSRGDIKLGQLAMLIANIEDELSKSRCPVILCGDFNIEPHSYIYKYIIESSVCLQGLYCSELSGQGLFGGPYVEADRILPPVTNIGRDSMFINNEAYREPDNADYFTHPLRLASVYRHVSVNGEKEISTFHKEVANPDYLFYSVTQKLTTDSVSLHLLFSFPFKSSLVQEAIPRFQNTLVHEDPELRLLRRLSLPDIPTLRKNCGPWPNRYVPSDHVPLVADFILSNSEICSIPN
uniref:Endo/exonuclease/phosphatase domain-containing protein n=1 Tax=Angiostrongylus cantonensis TaxID=6313 RepID=A0A0K0DJ13_ANGCA